MKDGNNIEKLYRKKRFYQRSGYTVLFFLLLFVLIIITYLFGYLITKGLPKLNLKFLFGVGAGINDFTIGKAILGTFLVTIITAMFSIPIGVCTAIYLNEYARQNKLNRIIRLAIRNLSGVPSIVYGLFGLIIFIRMAHMPESILAAGLTLGFMTLPWIITSSEEALRGIPNGYREGSLALGASRWYTIRKNVLPYSISGVITGSIIGLSRAAGETAPILFVGATLYGPSPGLLKTFEALPYSIYFASFIDANAIKLRTQVYGICVVLILIVFLLSFVAIIIRYKLRKKYKVV